jgi:hypothetical protein
LAWSDSTAPFFVSGGGTGTVTANVTADNATNWYRLANTDAGLPANFRKNIALASLVTNRSYTASWEVYNESATSTAVSVDWADGGLTTVTLAAGQRRVVSATHSRAYDSTFRFTDLSVNTPGNSVLVREIQVELATGYLTYFDGSTTPATFNMAKNCRVQHNSGSWNNISPVTDGRITTTGGSGNGYVDISTGGGTPRYVVVDLGSEKKINQIKVWHYTGDTRTYSGTKTEVSVDGTNWTTVFDSAVSGTYAESAGGKTHTFTRQYARYIRDWANDSTANASVHWQEIEAYDTAMEPYFNWGGTAFQAESRMITPNPSQWSHSVGGVQGGAISMTENGVTFVRMMSPANQQIPQWRLFFVSMNPRNIHIGTQVNMELRLRVGGGWRAGHTTTPQILKTNGLNGMGAAFPSHAVTSTWQTFKTSVVATSKPGNDAGIYFSLPITATTEDSWIDVEYAFVSTGPVQPNYFDANSPGVLSHGTKYISSTYMQVVDAPFQVLGHQNAYDGLVMDGTTLSFVTKYTNTGECRASFDLGTARNVVVQGVHTRRKNMLIVNGEVVATADISDEQQADTYAYAGTTLYSGQGAMVSEIALGQVAVYNYPLSSQAARRHAVVARDTSGPDNVAEQFGGMRVLLPGTGGDKYLDYAIDTNDEWNDGIHVNTYALDGVLYPTSEGVSNQGYWTGAVPIDAGALTSINDVMLTWAGKNETVETSLDGITWTAVKTGQPVPQVTAGFNPTNKALRIRISFPGLKEPGDEYVSNLRVVGHATATTSINQHTITKTGSPVMGRNFHHIEYSDDWGISLDGVDDSLVISARPTDAAAGTGFTIEIWAKLHTTANATLVDARDWADISTQGYFGRWQGYANPFVWVAGGGSAYVNGDPAAYPYTWNEDEWTLIHLTTSTKPTAPIRIGVDIEGKNFGEMQIGHVALYEKQLTAAEVKAIHDTYTGVPTVRANDSSIIAASVPGNGASIYAYDWSIQSAG